MWRAKGVDVVFTYHHARRTKPKPSPRRSRNWAAKAPTSNSTPARSPTCAAFAADLKKTLKETFGRESFDYLVNNAGTGLHKPFAQTSEAEFDMLMNIHFKGVYFLTQTLLPLIADGGRIVNLSSGLARFSLPGASAYAAMKGAVEVLTRYLAKELGARGIAVNTVAPGAIATDFNGGTVRDNKQVNDFVSSVTALGRTGEPDDIGPRHCLAAVGRPAAGSMPSASRSAGRMFV